MSLFGAYVRFPLRFAPSFTASLFFLRVTGGHHAVNISGRSLILFRGGPCADAGVRYVSHICDNEHIDVSRAGAFIAIIPIAAHSLRYYMLLILYREKCVHTFVANRGSAYDRMS